MKKNKKGIAYFALFLTLIVAMVFFFGCAANGGNGNEGERYLSIEAQAKQTYLDSFLKEPNLNLNATIDDVSFQPFLGIYDSVLVAGFYIRQNVFTFPDVVDSIEIDGLYIEWWVGIPILVWKDGNLFRLPVAAEQGILSKENLAAVKVLLIESRTKKTKGG